MVIISGFKTLLLCCFFIALLLVLLFALRGRRPSIKIRIWSPIFLALQENWKTRPSRKAGERPKSVLYIVFSLPAIYFIRLTLFKRGFISCEKCSCQLQRVLTFLPPSPARL
jgi:hypothetical protein